MTQPRKEQVKNLKTKYTRFTGVGSLALGGGPVQTISNTGLEAFYDNFLSVTKTATVGGAETSAPAILYGGSGPFSLVAGNSITLTIPGVNSGNPVSIVIQAGDIVSLGGSPVVTTSRMADRINLAMFGVGVTSPVAENVNGQLILKSSGTSGLQVGDSAVMTLAEITAGMLNALGFTTLASITSTGTTAPKRGVVTVSADGLGGTVQLRKLDTAVSDATGAFMRQTIGGVHVPEVAHGQPVFARLTAFPGPVLNGRNIKLSFFRNGPIRPRTVTSQGAAKSNFSTLTGGDSVAVSLNFGNGQTLNFNVTFSGITTVQNVVDKLNLAFAGATQAATSGQVDSTLSTVIFKMAAPYKFTSPSTKDSFFFSLNGQTAVHFNPPAGLYSASQLASYIGGRIGAAGQAGQGQAFQYTDANGAVYVGIRSVNADVTASSVRILPGNPGGSVPGQFMETLDMLGVSPGVYRAGTIAELYGNDEVEIHCPSSLPGATLTISGGAVTMGKLGLPNGVNVTTTVGVQPALAPTSHALIPEMVEFHEERDDYDSIVQDFDNKSPFNQLRPQDGTANVGLDQLLGPDGKLNASMLPRLLDFIGVDRMRLGNGMLNNILNSLQTPKISASHDSTETGYATLLFESTVDTSNPNANYVLRVYTFFDSFFITQNAKILDTLGSSAAFGRDSNGINSAMMEFAGQDGVIKLSYHLSSEANTWSWASWKTTFRMDSHGSGAAGDLLRIGEFFNANSDEQLRPRIGTPLANGTYHCIWEARGPESTKIRLYVQLGQESEGDFDAVSTFMLTVNARWDGSLFNKDVDGARAKGFRFSNDGGNPIEFLSKISGDDSPWDDQDWTNTDLGVYDGGASVGGTLGILGSPEDPSIAAINTNRWTNSGANMRTLLFESPQAGPFANCPVRIYLIHGTSFYGQGYEFTFNARWVSGLDRWYADDFGQKAYSWVMAQDRFWFLSRDIIGSEWTEHPFTGWSRYSAFDHKSDPGYTPAVVIRDGVFRVEAASSVSNPAASFAVQPNTVYAKSMIKAWGKLRGDGPSITSQTLLDGFNVNFVGYDGGAGAFGIQFATIFANTHYAVQFSGRASNYANPPVEPGSYFVWSGSKLSLYSAALIGQANYGFSYYPLTAQNGKPDTFLGTIIGQFMYFTVVGTQT